MKKSRILVVDDEPGVRKLCVDTLERLGGYELVSDPDGERAVERLQSEHFDLILTDVSMPGMSGVDLLRKARERDPDAQVLVMTGFPTVETAVESMKLGAADYITKPFLPDDLLANVRRLLESRRLREENRMLRRQVERPYMFEEILGGSPAMQKVFTLIQQAADSTFDVLVLGETGTGKELVARALHNRGKRAKERFVPVNSGAIPDNLLESELFGHERGAFTGADARSVGLMEFADKGTFFLDEVGELPLPLQAKLLRTLQERKIRRVGGKEELTIDVRFVAATAVDLEAAVKQKRFREDLFYRINVLRIDLPPLRERGEDIVRLAEHFVIRYAAECGKQVAGISPEAREVLLQYRWPGNIRELQYVVRRAMAVTSRAEIGLEDLPDTVVVASGGPNKGAKTGFFEMREDRINHFEREYLSNLLAAHKGDVAAAAEEAQIPRGTYYRLMKKYTLNAADFK
jgi:DNA-binding NtrC family response regulator